MRPSSKFSTHFRFLNTSRGFRLAMLFILVSMSILAGAFAFLLVRGAVAGSGGGIFGVGPLISSAKGTPVVNAEGTPIAQPPSGGAASGQAISPSIRPWDGASRVTILLLGLDYRDWESATDASRSDTMILLTLDPLTKSAGILSIPRDMWVAIPGFKHGKINTAYYLGEAFKLPGGGPALAIKTVEEFVGVPINYYAQIDFGAFVRFIDEIGGVKVDVPKKIKIDLLGDHNTKTLKHGEQVLPGEWALAYARARYTEGGDFDRARRQQQVILGIRERILSFEMLPTLIAKAPALYNELASGVHTNLSLDQIIRLALLAQEVSDANIQQGVFGEDSTIFGTSPDQLSILIPIPDKIHLLRDQIFATSSSVGPETPGDARQQMQAEAASLIILNGSGNPGLGQQTSGFLKGQGANVVQVGDAGQAYARTTVIDHSGNPYLLKYLVELMGINADRILLELNPNAPAKVEVILGNDWAAGNQIP